MAGDVSRVSLHVWESFMEKTGTGDPVGNNMHRENEADGSVLREGPDIPWRIHGIGIFTYMNGRFLW